MKSIHGYCQVPKKPTRNPCTLVPIRPLKKPLLKKIIFSHPRLSNGHVQAREPHKIGTADRQGARPFLQRARREPKGRGLSPRRPADLQQRGLVPPGGPDPARARPVLQEDGRRRALHQDLRGHRQHRAPPRHHTQLLPRRDARLRQDAHGPPAPARRAGQCLRRRGDGGQRDGQGRAGVRGQGGSGAQEFAAEAGYVQCRSAGGRGGAEGQGEEEGRQGIDGQR